MGVKGGRSSFGGEPASCDGGAANRAVAQRRRPTPVPCRGHWGVGPRKALMPVLKALEDNGTAVQELGVELDVKDTGFVGSNKANFDWLDAWSNYKYLLHTAGFSYSAGVHSHLGMGGGVGLEGWGGRLTPRCSRRRRRRRRGALLRDASAPSSPAVVSLRATGSLLGFSRTRVTWRSPLLLTSLPSAEIPAGQCIGRGQGPLRVRGVLRAGAHPWDALRGAARLSP